MIPPIASPPDPSRPVALTCRRGSPASRLGALVLALAGIGGPLAAQVPAEPPPPPVSLERTAVSPDAASSVLLTVREAGRVAVRAESEAGLGIRLVDRMTGPGRWFGAGGRSDGRFDVTLDPGVYRVDVRGPSGGTGSARLRVDLYRRRATLAPPPPTRLVETTLGDLEEVAWRLEVGEERVVHVEAGGRHLSELTLWTRAGWRVDARSSCRDVAPVEGRPIRVCRLGRTLAPGIYEVVASGGPPIPWPNATGEAPLWYREGISSLPETGRVSAAVGPLGVERYLIAGEADFLRLERPDPGSALLRTLGWNPADPTSSAGDEFRITKESIPPIVEVDVPRRSKGQHLVEVEAEAGQPFTLVHLRTAPDFVVQGRGGLWLETLHSGDPRDAFEATGILARGDGGWPRFRIVAADGPEAGPGAPWIREAPLAGPTTVFLRILVAGRYRIGLEDAPARARLKPFLIAPPPEWRPPRWESDGGVVDLEEGWHVLEIEPTGAIGSVVVEVRAEGDPTAAEEKPVRPSVRWKGVSLERNRDHRLFVNVRPGMRTGLLTRPVPLDLADPLPVAIAAGEELDLALQVEEEIEAEAWASDGSVVPLWVDGEPRAAVARLFPGRHRVELEAAEEPRFVTVRRHEPEPVPTPASALPPVTPPPLLATGEIRAVELAPETIETFRLRSDDADLVRIETTGLLDTFGKLRTDVEPELATTTDGGSGRNFLLQQVLREGDFLVSVGARGRSRGPAGLSVLRSAIRDGGALTPSAPVRATLPAGEASSWTFRLEEPERVRLEALGLGRRFATRLEDADGWPVVRPGSRAPVELELDAGQYRWIVLPEAVDARVVSTLEILRPPETFEGHGPHPLALDEVRVHGWTESPPDEPRVPDRWLVDLPAPTIAEVRLSNEMRGRLLDAGGAELAEVHPRRAWRGPLPAGRIVLEVEAARRDHLRTYEVSVRPESLVEGAVRTVRVPVDLDLAVGRSGTFEITTLGDRDVRAILLSPDGSRVAVADDRPDDWNPLLVERLEAGGHGLRIEPVADASAEVEVAVRRLESRREPALAVPGTKEIALDSGEILLPLDVAGDADAIVVRAEAEEPVRLDLERLEGESAVALGWRSGRAVVLEAPVEGRLRLRIAAPDRRGGTLRLTADAARPPRFAEPELPRGEGLSAGSSGPRLAWWTPERAGCFLLPEGLRLSGGGVATDRDGIVALDARPSLVASESADPGTIRRVALTSEDPGFLLRSTPGEVARCDLETGPFAMALEAEAVVGRAGIVARGARPDRGSGIEDRSAATLVLAGEAGAVDVWLAEGDRPSEIRLRPRRLAEGEAAELGFGRNDVEVSAAGIRRLALPAGEKRVRVSLGRDLLARLDGREGTEATWWADERTLDEIVRTSAETLLLAAVGETSRARIDVLPGSTAPSTVLARYESSGALGQRVEIAAGTGSPLELRGVEEAMLVGADGRIRRGVDRVEVPDAGGTLRVRPSSDSWWSWALGGDPAAGDDRTEAASVPLRREVGPGGVRLRVDTDGPALVEIRTSGGAVVEVGGPGRELRRELDAGALDLATWSPGEVEIGVRSLGATPVLLEVTALAAIPAGEGVGPVSLLAAGQRAVHVFETEAPGRVGFGVRADADSVVARLFDARGVERSSGVLQMLDLEAGTWILVLEQAADAAPVEARPVLVGLEPPSTGPPPEEARVYRERLGGGSDPDSSVDGPAEGD